MTRKPNLMRDFRVAVAAAILIGASGASHATVLTFYDPNSAGAVALQDYGDRVTGSPMNVPGGQFTYGNEGEGFTPNVVVDYFSGTDARLWTSLYGDLVNVLFARAPLTVGEVPGSLNVRLTADPGYEVQLYHFDLGGWPNADYTINGVSVFSGATPLFSQSDVLVQGDLNGPRHTAFDFPTPLSAGQLLIQIDFSNMASTIQDNIGIDNIRFGQNPPAPVPIPAAAWLFATGLLGLVGVARRRRPG